MIDQFRVSPTRHAFEHAFALADIVEICDGKVPAGTLRRWINDGTISRKWRLGSVGRGVYFSLPGVFLVYATASLLEAGATMKTATFAAQEYLRRLQDGQEPTGVTINVAIARAEKPEFDEDERAVRFFRTFQPDLDIMVDEIGPAFLIGHLFRMLQIVIKRANACIIEGGGMKFASFSKRGNLEPHAAEKVAEGVELVEKIGMED